MNQAVELQHPDASTVTRAASDLRRHLLSQDATRFFIQRYFALTFVLVGLSSLAMVHFATPAFRMACYFGMAIPVLSSFISFLVTEWAFEQPNAIFFIVALGSIVLRMFNLLLAFAVGLLVLKMNLMGLLVGLLGSYVAYLIIEISYIHTKGEVLGQ